MADLIKIKGGIGDVPTLKDRELAYRKDEKALYIGTENGNVKICGADDITRLAESIAQELAKINARLDDLTPPSE